MSQVSDRIVITGMGLSCSAGLDVDDAWEFLIAGRSSVRSLQGSLSNRWPGRYFAAGFPADPIQQQASVIEQANAQSRRIATRAADESTPCDSRVGLVFGSSKGRLDRFARTTEPEPGALAVGDAFYPWSPSSGLGDLRQQLPMLTGPATCPVAACASGLVSLVQAARWIEWRQCDAVVAGSADFSLTDSVLATYRRLGVLSHWSGEASAACRPFARDRSGFVIGEGVGALVLEAETHALERNSQPIAVWSGADHRTDPTGLIESDENGKSISVVVTNAIAAAGLSTNSIDAICCHGTGTMANDQSEAVALRSVFGPALDGIPCFSLKGAIGHTLGASGSVETVICVKALQEQVLPPHLHAEALDDQCPIGPLVASATPTALNHILKLSYGFGGHVAAAVISRYV